MPSFDVVSEINHQEIRNAVDQAKRELSTRFDFRNTDAGFELQDTNIVIHAEEEFQLVQLLEMLRTKCVNRKVDIKVLQPGEISAQGKTKRQSIALTEGIDADTCRFINKTLKNTNKKLQVQIQGPQIRISSKKRDELQEAMSTIRELDVRVPLQFKNLRD
ncbi:MAG: YajQ family cyclic di-GMP-binding protein [Gammaproteobacteria bacterium]|nr:YajQ family cyclic di-GMP-binding protein [Gammaproteobacteria bacterium]